MKGKKIKGKKIDGKIYFYLKAPFHGDFFPLNRAAAMLGKFSLL